MKVLKKEQSVGNNNRISKRKKWTNTIKDRLKIIRRTECMNARIKIGIEKNKSNKRKKEISKYTKMLKEKKLY